MMTEVMSAPAMAMFPTSSSSSSISSSSSSEAVISSFASYMRNLEQETRGLKSLFNLAQVLESGASVELQEVVNDIESIVSRLEMSVDIFDANMSQELGKLEHTLALLTTAKQQQAYIEEMSSSLGQASNGDSSISNANGADSNHSGTRHLGISEEEFLAVSKVTRNRLLHSQINEAFDWLTKYIVEKARVLKKGRGNLSKQAQSEKDLYTSMRCPEHGDAMFAAESELRNTMIYRAGDASGKSILQTLRALQKIKLIRCNGENTYILL